MCSAQRAPRFPRASCSPTTTGSGTGSRSSSDENRRDARSGGRELGRNRQRAGQRVPAAEPAVRHLPQPQEPRRRAARRRGDRRPDPGPRRARRENRPDAECARRPGATRVAQPAQGALEIALEEEQVLQAPREAPAADEGRRDAAARRSRRLQRLLHRHPPRHERRPAAAPRQSAAAELQMGADRLPRARLLDRRVRHPGRASEGPDQDRRRAGLRAEPAPGL